MSDKRKASYVWGIVAEYLCVIFLVFKGYSILAMRYRNHFGEIDIIAKHGKALAFIEVKARKNKEVAIFSVNQNKQDRVLRAANIFISRHKKYSHLGLRFDLMVVTSWRNIHHIKDAWRLK